MVDGYEGYQAVYVEQHLTRLGCRAHARRKFMDVKREQLKGEIRQGWSGSKLHSKTV